MPVFVPRPAFAVLFCVLLCAASRQAPATDRGGDCDDLNPNVFPGQTEVVGNRYDDDCDGLADEDAGNNPSVDGGDNDTDGISMASGDCNDTNPAVRAGIAEVPANAIDDDCDGLADESAANVPSSDDVDADGDGFGLFDRIFRGGFEQTPI